MGSSHSFLFFEFMIIIFSKDIDDSTSKVIEWLSFLDEPFIRINNANIREYDFDVTVDKKGLFCQIAGVPLESIKSVWYRRTGAPPIPQLSQNVEPNIQASIHKHLSIEQLALKELFYKSLNDKKWLSRPETASLEKYSVLNIANQVGLKIPATIVTNSKQKLLEFKQKHKRIIVKNICYTVPFKIEGTYYSTYTAVLEDDVINKYPDFFFPATFQELISKEYEIRVFYLDKKMYSMAIFSQNNKITEVDFRRYSEVPNRTVPYALPHNIEEKIINLMDILELNTGSLDLIKTKDDFVFLEVNPVGQFGMVSQPCNYYLEKEVALFLAK